MKFSRPDSKLNHPDKLADGDEFENLLSGISTSFARVIIDDIDDEIERWLGRIVSELGADCATISQFDFVERTFSVSHQWARAGIPNVPKGLSANIVLPWITGEILAGKTVVISRIEELPPEAGAHIQAIKAFGLPESNVSIPLAIGSTIVGLLTVGAFAQEQQWPNRTVRRLQLVAEIFSNALERKHSVSEIRRLRDELQQVAKVSIMGELTAWLAHEVNQPLSAILSNAQAARRFLAARRPNLSEVRAGLDEIISDNARAVESIRNVHALFRTGDREMSPVNLSAVLMDAERILKADAQRQKISLRINLPAIPPVITGIRTQLIQALLNLVGNAFDSFPIDWAGSKEVEIMLERDESRVSVTVRDCGSGIDPAVMSRLFQAFVTTKPKGLGVGLAIARTIIEKHGGRLWAEPNPDRGTSMRFYLPAQLSANETNA